jgi:uncharacterized protein YecT (DUF1311 family)
LDIRQWHPPSSLWRKQSDGDSTNMPGLNKPSSRVFRFGLFAVALAAALFDPGHVVIPEHAVAWAEGTAAEKDAFEAAKELGTVEAWDAFLSNYPTGFHADLARAYVKKLSEGSFADAPSGKAANSDGDAFPVAAGTWGGIVRSGPGQSYARQDSLAEGEPVALMGVSPELDNGYPWFKIWYGPNQKKGYMWGGILCAKGPERPDIFKTCTGSPAPAKAADRDNGEPQSECAENGNDAERAICANSDLSRMDAKLNAEYKLAISNITSEAVGGTEADVAKFRREQKDWLRKRDRCGDDMSCLSAAYKKRLKFFADYNQPE